LKCRYTPILVGSLGRIIVGPLADRFGGRTMFIAVCLASIVSVLAVGAAGAARSYPLLLAFGFLLGVAGTVFAVGIPFASNWFGAARKGFATGVFGMGMIGAALSAFFTPVRAVVRPVCRPCDGRCGAGSDGRVVCGVNARWARLHAEHRPGAAKAQDGRENTGHMGNVFPPCVVAWALAERGAPRGLRRRRSQSAGSSTTPVSRSRPASSSELAESGTCA